MPFPELTNIFKRAAARVLMQEEFVRLGIGAKSAQMFTPLSPGSGGFGWSGMSLLPRTQIDYGREVGDGLSSSVLMSPIKWIQRVFPEATLELQKLGGKEEQILTVHRMLQLLDQPNHAYSGDALLHGTIFSYIVGGDGYWIKYRGDNRKTGANWWSNVTDEVQSLWYAPQWVMEPKGSKDGSVLISHYEYTVGGQKIDIVRENVVHIRNGIDPRNPRHGLSMIYSEVREIFGDDEAANYTATMLKNCGVIGVVMSPDGGQAIASADDAQAVKEWLQQSFTADNRGKPLVMRAPTKVQQYAFDPKAMDLSSLRDVAEERICAAIGLPAAVVGFGTGLQQTKVGATLKELHRMAWEDCIIPMQTVFAKQIGQSLLPEFETKPDNFRLRFNHKNVPAMQENRKEIAEAMDVAVQGGWGKVAEARRAMGWPVGPEDEVYLRGIQTIEVSPDGDGAPPPKSGRVRIKATALEQRIIDSAERAKPTREQSRLIAQLNRDALALEKDFEAGLRDFFAKMGGIIADAALDVLERQSKAAQDELTAASILSAVEMELLQNELGEIGGAHYLSVFSRSYKTIQSVIGLAVDIPDERAREIVKTGGRRMGLVDLEKHTRDRLFRELSAGRELGEGPVELARRIRENVPAGPWSNSKVRARVIARTETLHAQRLSTLEAYRDADSVTGVMVFDNRTGFDDPECSALDGVVVSIDEAWELMNDEHPSGTRSFAPVVGGFE